MREGMNNLRVIHSFPPLNKTKEEKEEEIEWEADNSKTFIDSLRSTSESDVSIEDSSLPRLHSKDDRVKHLLQKMFLI